MLRQRMKPIRDKAHRKFIASLPCAVTGVSGMTQCAHIRSGNAGMGMKSGDNFCIPMSFYEHAAQHNIGSEENYWEQYGGIEKVKKLANELYEFTGQYYKALELLIGWKR